jgi:hypothetical protein
MPISPLLLGHSFDNESVRVIKLAFEMTRIALRLPDQGDPVNDMVATRIIALAKEGERNPDQLCELALTQVNQSRFKAMIASPHAELLSLDSATNPTRTLTGRR